MTYRNRAVGAALLAMISVPALAAPAGAAPAPAPRTETWKVVTRHEFDGSDLPNGCSRYAGRHSGTAAASWYDPQQVKVAGGQLRLAINRNPRDDLPYASGGVGCQAFGRTSGRFEVRAKAAQGKGFYSYLVLWPKTQEHRAGSVIHLVAPDKETAHIRNGYGDGEDGTEVPGTYSDGFHTYTFEWRPTGTRFLVDGRLLHASSRAYTGERWLGFAVASDRLSGVPDRGTRLPAEFVVDWFTIAEPGPPAAAPAVAKPSATAPSPTASASVEAVLTEPPPIPHIELNPVAVAEPPLGAGTGSVSRWWALPAVLLLAAAAGVWWRRRGGWNPPVVVQVTVGRRRAAKPGEIL
jgi:hypothetical protein